ncbi:isochorismate pyruvate lyase [Albidovulum inexpectatum]|uniref:chorismate mutase n=1 Tax=Albidovulum inexpectatum TaxID=196587 RepID=A0A2S5JKX8_9RHOB|nr:chorismate mutase [Albidovulum inexpectatum]PPB82166.1 isochorismate pyruvate lyase [Albidovulum inexpectatum]
MKPEECQTMADVRAEIDKLDAELVRLLARRVRYIDRAAELKPALGWPARIDARVEEVVRNVRAKAVQESLDAELVESIWRRLIDWSIAREEDAMARGAEGKPPR